VLTALAKLRGAQNLLRALLPARECVEAHCGGGGLGRCRAALRLKHLPPDGGAEGSEFLAELPGQAVGEWLVFGRSVRKWHYDVPWRAAVSTGTKRQFSRIIKNLLAT
jgi:hypothetical protein